MSLAFFPMFPDDFEADTAHLTLAEDGAYNRLLRLCWRTPGCSIPDDMAWIYRRMRAASDDDKAVVDIVLEEFFEAENGRLSNARLSKEWLAANEAHKRRKNAGAKGGKTKALKTKETEPSNAVAKPKQPEPQPHITIEANASMDGDAVNSVADKLWNEGVAFLSKCGVPDRQARSFIGKCLKGATPEEVDAAFTEAGKARTKDPIPYITEILKPPPDVQSVIRGAIGGLKFAT